jgi:hypothetical protein
MHFRSDFPMGIDVIVRLHDSGRLVEFGSALFSLYNQTFAPVHPIIVTQSFDQKASTNVQSIIDGFDWTGSGHSRPTMTNVDAPAGQDIRSRLLNVGIGLAGHRFLAFLDGDDYVYGDAYQYLTAQALKTGAAVTFGGIVCRSVRVFDDFVYTSATIKDAYPGNGLEDFIKSNFCPIHSFVVDRTRVSEHLLIFNENLTRLEDYDFLLRICREQPMYFESRSKVVGVYNWHIDGRGSSPFGQMDIVKAEHNKQAWNDARRHIWRLKTKLWPNKLPDPSASTAEVKDARAIPLLFPLGHFYSPIIDPADLRPREAQIWARCDNLQAIDLNPGAQLQLLVDFKPHTESIDYPIMDPGDGRTYFYSNDQYPVLDAEFLHAALVHFRPKRMIEVGSGFSSLVTARVNRELLSREIEFSCIEPYPRQFLIDGVDGISRVICQKVEDVDLSFFDRLRCGDILFIDSSHVSKAGSDVNYLFFEVLPRLQRGVLVHVHDIFLPDEYPREWVLEQGRNWNEQYLVRAFLQFNDNFSVIWAAHFMATRHAAAVRATFPRFPRLGGGGSLWLRRTR